MIPAYPPEDDQEDTILLMLDNSEITYNTLLILCNNKPKQRIVADICRYVKKVAKHDLISVGDKQQAECLQNAIREMESLMGDNVWSYWESVADYYIQKRSEI